MSPHIWLSHMLKMSRDQQKANSNPYIYGGLILSAWILAFMRSFFFYYSIVRASSKLHGKMTSAVIKSPVLFFDNAPPGRIYNRFAKDMGQWMNCYPQTSFGQCSYWCDCSVANHLFDQCFLFQQMIFLSNFKFLSCSWSYVSVCSRSSRFGTVWYSIVF